jgi:hypothetical protein
VVGIEGTPTDLVLTEMANASESGSTGGGCVLSFYNLRSTTITPNSFQIRARMLL